MKISAKGRYGLAAMINMAQNPSKDQYITIISISERLGISKIYLEQVFALLKKADLVISAKGSSGGYQLSRAPEQITAYDIIFAIEQPLYDNAKDYLSQNAKNIEDAVQSLVFEKVDNAIEEQLKRVTLSDLAAEAEKLSDSESIMFYI